MDSPMVTYHAMKSRCHHKNNPNYKFYGAKGITVCEGWLRNPIAFVRWAEANGWRNGRHIHRINNANVYSPETCEFLTPKEHAKKHRIISKINYEKRLIAFFAKTGKEDRTMTTESKGTFLTVVGEGTLIIRHIPDDIRRAFKAKCAMDGKGQQQRILELIEEDLKGGKGK